MSMLRQFAAVFLTAALVLSLGCASNKDGVRPIGPADELREVAQLITLYSGQNKRGPSKAADFAPFEAGSPLGYQAVKSGQIVVVWGATMAGEGEGGGSDAIVAYEKKAPTDGGAVLLQNGTVKQMTAAEFQSAKKAR